MLPRCARRSAIAALREPRVAHQIDREDALPGLGLRLGERLVGAHAGEIDQHVDRAERLARGGDRFRGGFLSPDIRDDAGDLRARHLRADVRERRVHRARWSLSTSATRAPSSQNKRPVAAPMPPAPPVMIATLSASRPATSSSHCSIVRGH